MEAKKINLQQVLKQPQPKQNPVPQFNWITKERCHNLSEHDVTISIQRETTKKDDKVCIRFRNNSFKKIVKTDVYVQCCVVGTRLYFRESNATEGYKLTNWNRDKTSCDIKLPMAMLPLTKVEVGDYNLEYHNQYHFFFIDVKNKVVEQIPFSK